MWRVLRLARVAMTSKKHPYEKPHLSFEDQAKRLIGRGLIANQDELTRFLSYTNYYRFSTYLYPFRQEKTDNFKPNTTFSEVRVIHDFDNELRIFIFKMLGSFEVSILRTHFVEFFTQRYGAFGYTDSTNFDEKFEKHKKLCEEAQRAFVNSKEEFANHFRKKYSDRYLPLWAAVEIMSFGNITTMIRNMHRKDKFDFARRYSIVYKVMDSWLLTLNYVRNCCAHHTRVWNRSLAVKPLIPYQKHRPEFYEAEVNNTRIFSVLTIIQYVLNHINSTHTWNMELTELLNRFPNIQIDKMGFPENWQKISVWDRS